MTSITRLTSAAAAIVLLSCGIARADDPTATMNKVTADGVGAEIGTIRVTASPAGAVFNVNVKDLPPGPHGFHVHQNADCGPGTVNGTAAAAGAAGGHWDPDHTGKHEGPTGEGHEGDLPVLVVLADGTATKSLIAPRIKDVDALRGHSLMIHAGGDNYSDQPAPLGGGGARIACGVIK